MIGLRTWHETGKLTTSIVGSFVKIDGFIDVSETVKGKQMLRYSKHGKTAVFFAVPTKPFNKMNNGLVLNVKHDGVEYYYPDISKAFSGISEREISQVPYRIYYGYL